MLSTSGTALEAILAIQAGSGIVFLRPCPSCDGAGGRRVYSRGSKMPDPQTDMICELCDGTGLDPGTEQ